MVKCPICNEEFDFNDKKPHDCFLIEKIILAFDEDFADLSVEEKAESIRRYKYSIKDSKKNDFDEFKNESPEFKKALANYVLSKEFVNKCKKWSEEDE